MADIHRIAHLTTQTTFFMVAAVHTGKPHLWRRRRQKAGGATCGAPGGDKTGAGKANIGGLGGGLNSCGEACPAIVNIGAVPPLFEEGMPNFIVA